MLKTSTCKHCGLPIHNDPNGVGGGFTGWAHDEGDWLTCAYATNNKNNSQYKQTVSAEPMTDFVTDLEYVIESVPVPKAKKAKKKMITPKPLVLNTPKPLNGCDVSICKNCGTEIHQNFKEQYEWEHSEQVYCAGAEPISCARCDAPMRVSNMPETNTWIHLAVPGTVGGEWYCYKVKGYSHLDPSLMTVRYLPEGESKPNKIEVPEKVPEKVPVKKPKKLKKPTEIPEGTQATCKHCGLAIRKALPASISSLNVTGWQHQASEYGMTLDPCWYAVDNSGVPEKLNKFQKPTDVSKDKGEQYKSVEQAEPTDEWLAAYGIDPMTIITLKPLSKPLLILGEPLSGPIIAKFKAGLNPAGVPEVVDTCMYCDQPVRLSHSNFCPNDWIHATTDYTCVFGATLDGQPHVADTFNTPNESSRERDRDQRTAFFEFLKNTYQKKAISNAAHDGTFPVGRKFRHDKVEKD